MKRLVWILILAVMVAPLSYAAPSGQYELPQLGQAGGDVATPADMDKLGHEILTELHAGNLILEDPLLTDYIRDVGHQIASHSDRPDLPVHYYVIRDPSINSFALPGGNVGIFTGLLIATDNENELAGVIAHETAHVTQHHVARSVADAEGMGWKALAGLLAGLLIGAQTGNPQVAEAAVMGTQAALIQHQINFTRHDEAEADRVGISFMARAGYDPRGMAQMFQKFEMLSRGDLQPPAFLVDHPLDAARITDASERADQMHASPHPDSRGYLLMRARARVLVADSASTVLTYFNNIDTSKLSPMARDAIAYGRALCLTRMNRAKEAIKLLTPLLAQHQDVVAFHLALANAELQRGDTAGALARFDHAERVFPDSLAVKFDHAQALMDSDRPTAAKNILQTAVIANPDDPAVIRLLADAASRGGNVAEGRYYLSRFYEMNGKLGPALDQIQLALNAPHIDRYEEQRYQARLDDLRHLRAERQREQGHMLQWHAGVRRAEPLP